MVGLAPRPRRREGERRRRPWPFPGLAGPEGRAGGRPPGAAGLDAALLRDGSGGKVWANGRFHLGPGGRGSGPSSSPAAGRLRGAPLGLPGACGERGRGREIQLGGACGDGQKGRLAGGGRPGAAGALSDGAAPAFLSAPPPAGRPHASSRSGSVLALALALLSASPWRRRS